MLRQNEKDIIDTVGKANVLSQQYESVFSDVDFKQYIDIRYYTNKTFRLPELPKSSHGPMIAINITTTGIVQQLQKTMSKRNAKEVETNAENQLHSSDTGIKGQTPQSAVELKKKELRSENNASFTQTNRPSNSCTCINQNQSSPDLYCLNIQTTGDSSNGNEIKSLRNTDDAKSFDPNSYDNSIGSTNSTTDDSKIKHGQENLNTPVNQHENNEIRCPDEQKEVLAKYYEHLATPHISNEYDKEYLQTCQLRYNIIKELAQNSKDSSVDFSENDILAAIQNLNSGKARDEHCLFAEHLKLAGTEITPVLKLVFNRIIKERRTPEHFKTGIITPVCKKGKDSSLLDSYIYRVITVSSILGKTFEHALLNTVIIKLENHSSQQFGFSHGLSPSMAALLILEAQMNSKQMKEILYLATLDTKKAFDVVNHDILVDKLFQRDIPLDIWETIYEMYHDLTSRIN
ncbi:unnamed protein product [Mytilus coruscus]|uniref:Reverse transcriptase domain-containing protein n=1 Tax=Mytilus coruscus TaxID=42192 RepID=A0A6J8DM24_MYTCO|nr:unnamed protein product [Mytilus coruscus]